MDNIYITKTSKADTRIEGFTLPDKQELRAETIQHIEHVKTIGTEFYQHYIKQLDNHDWTKIHFLSDFHDNMGAHSRNEKFKDGHWWKCIHTVDETHHFMEYTGKDKLLLEDVLENVFDGVAAGIARNGKYVFNYNNNSEEDIKNKLFEAYKNTCEFVASKVKLL